MNEKGFRTIKCPSCSKKIRMSITEKHYGKKGHVTCPGCGQLLRVTIPVPAKNDTPITHNSDPVIPSNVFDDIFGDLLNRKK